MILRRFYHWSWEVVACTSQLRDPELTLIVDIQKCVGLRKPPKPKRKARYVKRNNGCTAILTLSARIHDHFLPNAVRDVVVAAQLSFLAASERREDISITRPKTSSSPHTKLDQSGYSINGGIIAK